MSKKQTKRLARIGCVFCFVLVFFNQITGQLVLFEVSKCLLRLNEVIYVHCNLMLGGVALHRRLVVVHRQGGMV